MLRTMERFAGLRASVFAAGAALGVLFSVACEGGTSATPTAEPPTPTVETIGTPMPPTPSPTATELLAPIFAPLMLGEPVPLPDGYTLYVLEGCTGCDAPPSALMRVRRVAEDAVQLTRIFDRSVPGPYILGGWVSPYGVFITECTTGVCFGDESSADASVTLYHSEGGGDTWEPLATLPGGHAEPADWVDWLVPGVVPVIDWSEAGTGLIVVDGVEVTLEALDLRARKSEGGAAYGVLRPVVTAPYGTVIRWYARVAPGQPPLQYLSVFDLYGAPRATWAATFNGVWLDEDHLLVTAVYGEDGGYPAVGGVAYAWLPSVVDIKRGTIHPIVEPFAGIEGRNTVIGALAEAGPPALAR